MKYPEEIENKFPNAGDKIVAKEVFPKWFYPHFTSMVKDGLENIVPNKEYTVAKRELYSSWCAVWLEELSDTEERTDRHFNLGFFNYEKNME